MTCKIMISHMEKNEAGSEDEEYSLRGVHFSVGWVRQA